MKISIIGPVKNEAQFIGYSIMAVLPYVHEFVYACAASDDGTQELLNHIASKYADGKIKILTGKEFDFDTKDMKAYNNAFNECIDNSTGNACWFLHPDMICTNAEKIQNMPHGPLAWWVNITSYARDFSTVISKGRTDKWKNIQLKKFGLHYYGEYGSVNEDFYFRDITGKEYFHYGDKFQFYPYVVCDSGLFVNHYCELKPYKRRYEKMKSCLRNLYPQCDDKGIEEMAMNHPRVSLESSSRLFGEFEFVKYENARPAVFDKYEDEFNKVLGVAK